MKRKWNAWFWTGGFYPHHKHLNQIIRAGEEKERKRGMEGVRWRKGWREGEAAHTAQIHGNLKSCLKTDYWAVLRLRFPSSREADSEQRRPRLSTALESWGAATTWTWHGALELHVHRMLHLGCTGTPKARFLQRVSTWVAERQPAAFCATPMLTWEQLKKKASGTCSILGKKPKLAARGRT